MVAPPLSFNHTLLLDPQKKYLNCIAPTHGIPNHITNAFGHLSLWRRRRRTFVSARSLREREPFGQKPETFLQWWRLQCAYTMHCRCFSCWRDRAEMRKRAQLFGSGKAITKHCAQEPSCAFQCYKFAEKLYLRYIYSKKNVSTFCSFKKQLLDGIASEETPLLYYMHI